MCRMEKQTKNIITRAEIEKKLRTNNLASLKHTGFTFFVSALVGILWFAFSVPSLLEATNFGLGILFFLFSIVGTVPAFVMLAGFLKDLKEYQHLKNGDVEIVTRSLLYKSQKEVRVYCNKRTRWQTRNLFNFEGFDEFWASPEMHQNFTWGDEFYIVYYRGSKKVEEVFPLKLYEYKE